MTTPQNLFDNVAKFVADSKNLVAHGSSVEMAGLDKHVQELCSQILKLSQDERIKYADLLQKLLSELHILSEDMVTQRDALVNEIRYLSSHKKANIAYQTADKKSESGANEEDKK